MKKVLLIFLELVLALVALVFVLFTFFSYQNPHDVELSVPKGSSVGHIAQLLDQKEVIPHAFGFKVLVMATKKGSQLKAGDYVFEAGLKPLEILTILAEGRVSLESLTIPEGQNLRQISLILQKAGFVLNEADWVSLMTQEKWRKKFEIPTSTLEGYLFPETYAYSKSTKVQELVDSMLQTFEKQVTSNLIDQAKQAGFTLHQWVTLASIIEKETGVAQERPIIARVFLNRLAIGMPLQTDPTVIYGIENFDGNLRRSDLERDTPYNTYTRNGLPLGPICSPGLASLKAVLSPSTGDYLYFVAKGDGTHYFSKSLEEHNKAVDYYQRHQGSPPGE